MAKQAELRQVEAVRKQREAAERAQRAGPLNEKWRAQWQLMTADQQESAKKPYLDDIARRAAKYDPRWNETNSKLLTHQKEKRIE